MDPECRDQRRIRRLERQHKLLKTELSLHAYVEQRDYCVVLANQKQRMFYRDILASTNNQSVLFNTVSELWNRKKVKALPSNNGNMKILADDFNNFFTDKVTDIRNSINSAEPSLFEPDSDINESHSTLLEFQPATLEEL